MKLTVKTLKGGKFQVDCEPSNTVLEVKGIVESSNAELPAANMKLIHSGKVLKDDQTIESCGIKQNDFLVVMVTKPKKAAPAPAPAAAAAPAPAASSETAKEAAAPAPADKPAEAPAAASSAPAPAAPAADSEFPAEIVGNLTAMGFPEAEVRHCLRAANGNPDVAVEFLTNGIPPGMQPGEQNAAGSSSGGGGSGSGGLASLRNHPQFNALRRLVQSDPGMLQSVLAQIGQQQPELLAEINANQEAFIQLMNEPITETSTSSTGGDGSGSSAPAPAGGSGAGAGMQGLPPGMLEGMANPAQMAQLIQNMSPDELNQMAAMMGLSADQLRTTAQMLGQIPPEQLQQYMMQAMQGGGPGGLGGMMGGGSGPQVLRLTEEEMAAVDRLADLGFDRTEAAQAYLACDKNEALAANLLMDSMADGGGFGFGGDGGGAGGDGANQDNDDGDDNMYD